MKTIKSIINHQVFPVIITVLCLAYVWCILYLTCEYNNIAIMGFGLIIMPLIAACIIDCLTEESK